MTKQSWTLDYAKRLAEQLAQKKIDAAQKLMIQYMSDTLQIAIHQTEGWGYERIKRLCDAWTQVRREYSPVMNTNDPSADVYREHMDRVMLEIIGKKQDLIPFDSRYPELKKVKYGK